MSLHDAFHHSQLPSPFRQYVSYVILEHVPNADYYLIAAIVLLTSLVFVQLRAFSSPKPVPLKELPQRPALHILFKPDDSVPQSTTATTTTTQGESQSQEHSDTDTSKQRIRRRTPSDVMKSVTETIFRRGNSKSDADFYSPDVSPGSDIFNQPHLLHGTQNTSSTGTWQFTTEAEDSDLETETDPTTKDTAPFPPNLQDLPDSFAPLLSSSHVEVIRNQLTTDLIHAVQIKGGVRIREGRHEVPLDKDNSRPQFVIHPPKGGCRLTAAVTVGSDGLTLQDDMDVHRPTITRSHPMVKSAGVVLDPPLALANVAPTLIHFPTLFEDRSMPTLRRIQIVRLVMDAMASISSFLEKVLWILESKCQIHLSKVQITPLYKGNSDENNPEWRLSLSFSGHVLIFGFLPIPFINITLPTFIIPQPHALLQFLLTPQPLASATLRRDQITEQRILALAGLEMVSDWNVSAKAVATPPALGVDVTLSGGVALAIEVLPGRDVTRHQDAEDDESVEDSQGNSMSSWTTRQSAAPGGLGSKQRHLGSTTSKRMSSTTGSKFFTNSAAAAAAAETTTTSTFDANKLVPWKFNFAAKGTVSRDRMTANITKCTMTHEDDDAVSNFSTAGSFAVWKADLATTSETIPVERRASYGHLVALSAGAAPTVGEILLYPEENTSSSPSRILRLLHYDYAFDVYDTNMDAVTCSVGASHPMLRGGTMITTILESIYLNGSATARQGAIINPGEWKRKRNILRHLPAVDMTFGIQNVFIPPESLSYSDTGQTKCVPELDGGRVMVRFLGGIEETREDDAPPVAPLEGIKIIVDMGVENLFLKNSSSVKEFPELEIFEGVKLITLLSGTFSGQVSSHLRPQTLSTSKSTATTGPNTKNPLEAYEIDFGNSSLAFKIKESTTTLGHRRVIIPTETTIAVKIVESVVDMSLEGKTQCELSWDFQGLSPILQVTDPGQSPADVMHEKKRQVSLLIAPLRQGRLNFHVSPVGGIAITQAKTSRDDREGLYDWKFFNALVSPDDESGQRLMKVVHDKRTMGKVLQVLELVNTDLHKIARYVLKQVWRAKEIFDQEGVSDPGHAIPGHKLARLISLFMCGDVSQVHILLPIIRRVTSGEGLDVVKVKELLRKHVELYDDWAPEIDRAVRWAALMLGPMAPPPQVAEGEVPPLCEVPRHAGRFHEIPSARQLYNRIHDKPSLPLERSFSNHVSLLSPYLSVAQVEYLLQVRKSTDWQPSDLRRLRYVYAVKKKVLDISESYGGLSFLPQSFLVSVFLGEATRASLRASRYSRKANKRSRSRAQQPSRRQQWSSTTASSTTTTHKDSTLSVLRRRRMQAPMNNTLRSLAEERGIDEGFVMTPAGRVASQANFVEEASPGVPVDLFLDIGDSKPRAPQEAMESEGPYELGDSLLGPTDVAILLQAGLTSAMKSSTVVQLNQRMLLDLIATQPRSFAIAVLAEIGFHGGQGSPRGLTSALMALLELDQSSFTAVNRLDMHTLLESWLPGFKVPRRNDYMAGGRWARQSYYEALFSVAKGILEDAECYMALKSHIQRDRRNTEDDPLPKPKEYGDSLNDLGLGLELSDHTPVKNTKLTIACDLAKEKILEADRLGHEIMDRLVRDEANTKGTREYAITVAAYQQAFELCARVLEIDKMAFQADWFRDFYRRNYDALMIQSMHSNVLNGVDNVRHWFAALRKGSSAKTISQTDHPLNQMDDASESGMDTSMGMTAPPMEKESPKNILEEIGGFIANIGKPSPAQRLAELKGVDVFSRPTMCGEQALIDAIIDAIIYVEADREHLKHDPLVRLLIPNPPGKYNFAIVTAMGVITEGERGKELDVAFERLHKERGVKVVRSDTGTARSVEYNAARIIEAIGTVNKMKKPYGLLGYSQGCANALTAESLLLSGSPQQQAALNPSEGGLVCRQLMFSAANGSTHGPAVDSKVQRLIVMTEEFFKYQQGYFSRAFSSSVLEVLNGVMDSSSFQKMIGGAQSFLPDGCRAFWREAQHLPHIPTCTMRGVLESHTIPESLEMISHLLTKQSGSALHDSQVHVYDAVPYPVYCSNRNGRLLKSCAVGDGAIQRTHHWSPLSDEVEFVRTQRDVVQGSFECAKDRHVYPWVDVNARFGFIKYDSASEEDKDAGSSSQKP